MVLISRHRTLSVLKDNKGTETYAVAFNVTGIGKERVLFPTVCQIPGYGLRLYATRFLVRANGFAQPSPEDLYLAYDRASAIFDSAKILYSKGRKRFGLGEDPKVCRTVRLTSNLKSAAIQANTN